MRGAPAAIQQRRRKAGGAAAERRRRPQLSSDWQTRSTRRRSLLHAPWLAKTSASAGEEALLGWASAEASLRPCWACRAHSSDTARLMLAFTLQRARLAACAAAAGACAGRHADRARATAPQTAVLYAHLSLCSRMVGRLCCNQVLSEWFPSPSHDAAVVMPGAGAGALLTTVASAQAHTCCNNGRWSVANCVYSLVSAACRRTDPLPMRTRPVWDSSIRQSARCHCRRLLARPLPAFRNETSFFLVLQHAPRVADHPGSGPDWGPGESHPREVLWRRDTLICSSPNPATPESVF